MRAHVDHPDRRRRAAGARVWLLVAALAIAGVALWAPLAGLQRAPAPRALPWWLLAGMFFLTETHVVHLQFRRDAHSFSLSEVPIVLGLLYAGPPGLLGAWLLGGGLALATSRHQPPRKLAFNLASAAASLGLTVLVFRRLAPPGDIGPATWAGAFLATQAGVLASWGSIVAAIRLSGGHAPAGASLQAASLGMAAAAADTSLALLAATVIWWAPAAALLLVLPVATVVLAYRAFELRREQHARLELLHETGRRLHRSLRVDATVEALLHGARDLFHAEVAEVVLRRDDEDRRGWWRATLGPDDRVVAAEVGAPDPVLAAIVAGGDGLLLPQRGAEPRQLAWLAGRGLRDALVVPLSGSELRGAMLVGDRLTNQRPFGAEDLQLLETLAAHASSSLDNARLVGRLRESLERLQESNQLKDDFVAAVSHELRTPLTAIQGSLATLLRPDVGLDPELERSLLEGADRQSKRLRHLIEDLLVVARLEGDQEGPHLADVQLEVLVKQVVEDLGERAGSHRLELAVDTDLGSVGTDPARLYQILANLVENACKYAPDGTTVRVGAGRRGGEVVVSVADQGPGIPPEERERVFERFYQVDQSTTRRAGGVGLGLYLCRRLAATIGAEVLLERSGPDGSVFAVRLPKAAATRPPGAAPAPGPAAGGG
jgi:signal transduction histidine kinase